jgi:8-oxo-dGTP pyrophosphatase MutT (NUDIX family)
MSTEQILETLTRTDGKERVLVVRRSDGLVTYRRQFPWGGAGPDCGLYDCQEAAVSEARARIWWLALSAGLKIPAFGSCPFCRQGDLEACVSRITGRVILMCDDCALQWDGPDRTSYGDALRAELTDLEPATPEEIGRAGWGAEEIGSGLPVR